MDRQAIEWRSIGAAPISADAPGGDSVRYDPDFELLEAQVQKLEDVSRPPVDWNQVVALGRQILRQKSKDLLVSSYLALGLLETEGLTGLSQALACLEGMVSELWPFLHPEAKRSKARASAVSWLAERAGSAVSRMEAKPADVQAALVCEEQVKSLQALLEEKLGSGAPDLADLLRPLQELSTRFPSEAPATRLTVEPRPQSMRAAAPLGTAASIETLEDARRLLKDGVSSVKRALSVIRGKDPSGAASYRLVRSLVWCDIDELPPSTDGRSRIPPPPAHLKDRLRFLAGQSAWNELVHEAEARVAEFPFWLDLHRMSCQALADLGPEHARARDAVRAEVALILDRLPGLSELEFSDGTPFADATTRAWIAAEIFPAREERPSKPEVQGERDESLDELRRESHRLLREGKQQEAIILVQEAMRTAVGERSRFLARLGLARLCLDAGQIEPALAHLEMLDEHIVRCSLETWDPEASMEVLRTYWDALKQSAKDSRQDSPEAFRRTEAVYRRLCRLDVTAGMRASSGQDIASIGRVTRS